MSKPTQTQPAIDDDTLNPKVAASALDFLLIELVPLAQRVTEQLHAREQALIDEYKRSRIFNRQSRTAIKSPAESTQPAPDGTITASTDDTTQASVTGTDGPEAQGITSLGFPAMTESTREGVFWRLDGMGYRVGQGLVER